jgi:hypothetical protein
LSEALPAPLPAAMKAGLLARIRLHIDAMIARDEAGEPA